MLYFVRHNNRLSGNPLLRVSFFNLSLSDDLVIEDLKCVINREAEEILVFVYLFDNRGFHPILHAMSSNTDYNFYKTTAQAIKKLRSKAWPKMSQEMLAEKSGLKRAVIANIERGRQQILLHTLYKIAKALNVSPVDLQPSANLPHANSTDNTHGVSQVEVDDLKKKQSQ